MRFDLWRGRTIVSDSRRKIVEDVESGPYRQPRRGHTESDAVARADVPVLHSVVQSDQVSRCCCVAPVCKVVYNLLSIQFRAVQLGVNLPRTAV